ncbi:LBP_cg2779 family protein [uncultured Limosilactobacillus sp.]|uniref:LBP_cg2779 family protein n=1 Tax=uncultured Limosilactobacillus sp. TaxID=2837629 RepID=UPI0025F94756|nr:LBP_cg2779 family protein [uncultured Limosilactobacillus sp.]
MDHQQDLAAQLLEFERQKELTDNAVALGSQLSVERVHDIKSRSSQATAEEAAMLEQFMQSQGSNN